MRATALDDLQVYQQAKLAADAVSIVLGRPCFQRDQKLRDQINDAVVKIAPNIAEGFGQKTDRHCAHFRYIARESCNELQAHLAAALGRHYAGSRCRRLPAQRQTTMPNDERPGPTTND